MKNKQAVVIGGSNGIGLSITIELINRGYYVNILDICEPSEDDIKFAGALSYKYHYFDVLNVDYQLIDSFVQNSDVEILMISAGIGKISEFENVHISEIDKTMGINATSAIKLLRMFYGKIKSEKNFYCGVMCSIAGLVSSPMFSLYAASKSALCRFIESVNIELECSGISNRILNVSPGSIQGTRFNGGQNEIQKTAALATDIVQNLLEKSELFIPDYEGIYQDVLHRYQNDPHAFGLSSYMYKKESGRVKNERKVIVGYLSGTFDLFHIGHLKLIKRAKAQCDYLIVGVHPDASHKGKETFIPFNERMDIVGACKYVDRVVQSCSEDSDAWDLWKFNRLFVGSDYKGTERFNRYEQYFSDKDVEIVYFPYTTGTSSTQIRELISNKKNK